MDENGNVIEDVVDGVGDAGKDVIDGVENGVNDLTNDATGGNAENTNGTGGNAGNDREIQKKKRLIVSFFVPVYSDTFHGLLCQADCGAYNLCNSWSSCNHRRN